MLKATSNSAYKFCRLRVKLFSRHKIAADLKRIASSGSKTEQDVSVVKKYHEYLILR